MSAAFRFRDERFEVANGAGDLVRRIARLFPRRASLATRRARGIVGRGKIVEAIAQARFQRIKRVRQPSDGVFKGCHGRVPIRALDATTLGLVGASVKP